MILFGHIAAHLYIFTYCVFQDTYWILLKTKAQVFPPVASELCLLSLFKIVMYIFMHVYSYTYTYIQFTHFSKTDDPNYTLKILWRIGEMRNAMMANFMCQFD